MHGEFAEPAIARKIYSSAFPLVDITVVPDDEIMQHRKMALLELIQKHIRQRDLLGLVDQIVSLLVTGNTNDRQLKALFNYVLQTGDAQRFRAFIGEIAERAPQEKEKLMTIADRLREEGAMQGKHEEALFTRTPGTTGDLGVKLGETLCRAKIGRKQRAVYVQ